MRAYPPGNRPPEIRTPCCPDRYFYRKRTIGPCKTMPHLSVLHENITVRRLSGWKNDRKRTRTSSTCGCLWRRASRATGVLVAIRKASPPKRTGKRSGTLLAPAACLPPGYGGLVQNLKGLPQIATAYRCRSAADLEPWCAARHVAGCSGDRFRGQEGDHISAVCLTGNKPGFFDDPRRLIIQHSADALPAAHRSREPQDHAADHAIERPERPPWSARAQGCG